MSGILILLALSGISATDSLRTITLQGKLGVFIPMPQIYKLSQVYVRLDLKTALADSFRNIINQNNVTIKLQDAKISTYDTDLRVKQEIIDNDQAIILNYKKLDKKSARQIKSLKIQRSSLILATAILIGKILLFK
jgi:hypothetical protein